MIKADRVDRLEARQIVLVRYIISVPSDHVKRRMSHPGHEQCSLVLGHDSIRGDVTVLKPSSWRLKIARICQTVGADRAEVGQSEMIVEHLQDVAADGDKRLNGIFFF